MLVFVFQGVLGFVCLGVLGFVCLGVPVLYFWECLVLSVLVCFLFVFFVLLGVLGSACLSGTVFDLRQSMDACFGLSGSAWFCLSGSR